MPPIWTERQRRFLTAYEQQPAIAPAARLAGLHRSTVYRWRADPAFQFAMVEAFDAWHKGHLARYVQDQAERQRLRAQREAQLRPMRLRNLEKARAARVRLQF